MATAAVAEGADQALINTLANGVRVVALPMPHLASASVSVFVRAGSAHESRALNGISHVVEHMVFKGTASRDARAINLDAERLGARVDAHTDKDHTAFHLQGLAAHAGRFVQLLGDIVQQPSFPADEFERERAVLLHEYTEDEDDPMAAAYRLFDRACWGLHPLAQPVIGSRANVQRFTRDDLLAHVQRHYCGANVIVAAAGAIDPEALLREAESVFGALPRGAPSTVTAPVYRGGLRAQRLGGSSQVHVVLGLPVPPLSARDPAAQVAATLFGEGMSSPLMAQVRERQGLVYYAACAADLLETGGQFVVEASTAPAQLADFVTTVARLLTEQAASIDAVDLERAHNQLLVRLLRAHEKPTRRLEEAALDLFVHGRLRSRAERADEISGVDAAQVRNAFATMLGAELSLAVTGAVARGTRERLRELLAGSGLRLGEESAPEATSGAGPARRLDLND